MLEYAWKLTRDPHRMTREDVRALREAEFDDTAILDICQITGYFNFVNRLADGLGVEIEDYWTEETLTMTREEFAATRRPHE